VRSQEGVEISAGVARNFGDIQTHIQKLETLAIEIATASGEQSQGINQVTTAMSQMDQVTQANASNAEETAAAAEELSSQARTLSDIVGQLQALTGTTIAQSIDSETASAPRVAKPAPVAARRDRASNRPTAPLLRPARTTVAEKPAPEFV
jgi:methyl-accepting chemotaxis protein